MLTRRGFIGAAAAGALTPWRTALARLAPSSRPRPSRDQLAWQRDERAMFFHFGMNTFTDREWGDGTEDPAVFAPENLDARQWTRTAKRAGFRAAILTAKHHDGFCLWPTRTTKHSVASSPWRDGRGDLVREFVDACQAEGLKPGLYLSPWDRNASVYGDSPRYNDFYCDQLTELLTHYGHIHEVWFDGANGEGPNGKKQTYDWPRVWSLVRRLQPHAIIFSDAGPDVRWIGTENGVAGDPNWSTVDPAVVPVPGTSGREATLMMQHGDPNGTVWRPGETDVSIRKGWFHHPSEQNTIRSVDNLLDLYFTSVGRNSKLLLNVPPNRAGRLDDVDGERLAGMHDRLSSMFTRTREGLQWTADITGPTTMVVSMEFKLTGRFSIIDLREDIEHQGQCVARYTVEGSDGRDWRQLSTGTTIGYRKLDRITPTDILRLRLRVENIAPNPPPLSIAIGLY